MANSKVNIALVLSAYDKASAVVNRVTNNAIRKLDTVSNKASMIADKSFNTGRQLIAGGLAMAAPIAYAADKAISFEESMADVAKVLNMQNGSKELAAIGVEAQNVAVYLGQSNSAAAGMIANLAQGGVAKKELIQVATLAGEIGVAFDMSADVAGDRFVKMKNALGATIDTTKKAMDAANFISNNEAVKAYQLLDFMASGGASVARTMKVGAPDIQAYGAALIAVGKSGEEAGTVIERFQKGILSNASMNAIFKGAGGGSAGMFKILETANKSGNAFNFFNNNGFGAYSTDLALMASNLDLVKRVLSGVGDESNYLNSVHEEFANRSNTTAFKLQQVKTQAEQLAIKAGSTLLPVMIELFDKAKPYIDRLSLWMEKNKGLTKNILMVTAGLSAFALIGGYVSFVVGGLSKGWGVLAKGGSILFRSFRAIRFGIFAVRFAFVTKLLPGLKVAGMAFRSFGMALMTNPLTLYILAAVALAAIVYVVIRNWDKIKAFFVRLWAATKAIFSAAWQTIKKLFLNYTPHGLIIKHWDKIKGFFNNLWSNVKGIFKSVVNWFVTLNTKFFNAGSNIVKSIWNGIKSMASKPVQAIKAIVTKIRNHLPFSPAKEGPLKDIHRIKLVETIAQSIKPNALTSAFSNTLSRFSLDVRRPSPLPALAGAGGAPNFTFNITINGDASKKDATNLMSEIRQQLDTWYAQKMQEQSRRSF